MKGIPRPSRRLAVAFCAALLLPAGPAAAQEDETRARFIEMCSADNGRTGVCACLADSIAEKFGPMELELMVDMHAAERRGEDPFEAIARDRGMSMEEVRQATAMISQRMAAAMQAIDPMKCAGVSQ